LTIADTIKSVLSQSYPEIEYIIVDGGSDDGTIDIIKSFGSRISKFISEPDSGIYDAINKGIRLSTGEIIGILHSDDFFTDKDIIARIASLFRPDVDAVIGDAIFVDPSNLSRVVRYYSSADFTGDKFKYGFMPAHTGFYARRELFEKYGYYKTDYKIAADFELLIRFIYLIHIRYVHLPVAVASMRMGGVSNRSIKSKIILNTEIIRACKENGIKTNYFYMYLKYFRKIFEFLGNRRVSSE
jgi:glycosyltransferase involved in cell wall biosynthesis